MVFVIEGCTDVDFQGVLLYYHSSENATLAFLEPCFFISHILMAGKRIFWPCSSIIPPFRYHIDLVWKSQGVKLKRMDVVAKAFEIGDIWHRNGQAMQTCGNIYQGDSCTSI